MEAHRLNGTWEIVKLPPGKCAIGSRWFMKVKTNADGSLDCYKARMIAKSYLSVEKSDSEGLDSLINRVDEQIRVIKSLSPSSFTLDDLYDELAVMAIIRALPQSFDDVVRTISVLDKFDKQSVIQSLRNMDHTRANLSSTTSAFAASSGAPRRSQNASTAPASSSSPSSSQNSQNRAPNRPKCDFCSRLGHIEAKCFLKERLMRQMSLPLSSTAAPASTTPQPTPQAIPDAPQSAYIASASALFSASSPDSHFSSWNADSGASAHMTFNRHWMRNMTPHHTSFFSTYHHHLQYVAYPGPLYCPLCPLLCPRKRPRSGPGST